jgi:hypothetical protein
MALGTALLALNVAWGVFAPAGEAAADEGAGEGRRPRWG